MPNADSTKGQEATRSSGGDGRKRALTQTGVKQQTAAAESSSRWTVMVYMAADDSTDLDAHAVHDLKEIERALPGAGVDVVVQINRYWPKQPQRYELVGGQLVLAGEHAKGRGQSKTDDTGADGVSANMGAAETFRRFLHWAGGYYAAEPRRQFFLVLWGHAYGLGFGRDHGDPLSLKEIRTELDAFKGTRKGTAIELVGANACAMSYAEAAFELFGVANYLVASQVAVPFAGWPYDAILSRMSGTMSAEQVGQLVVDRYVTHFGGASTDDHVAMSLLDLRAVEPLQALIENLTVALVDVIKDPRPGSGPRLTHLRAAFLASAAGDVRPLIDLVDLCSEIVSLCTDLDDLEREPGGLTGGAPALEELRKSALAVVNFLEPTSTLLGPRKPGPAAPPRSKFLRLNKHHPALDGLHGLGIFAPFVTNERDLKRLGLSKDGQKPGRIEYSDLELFKGIPDQQRWDRLVYDVLDTPLPAAVLANVEGSGATTREDRSSVTQMLSSVDSIFDVLDRRLAATMLRTHGTLPTLLDLGASGLGTAPSASGQLGRLVLLRRAEIAALLKDMADPGGPPAGPTRRAPSRAAAAAALTTAEGFELLEAAIGRLERAVRRTMSNAMFGLGPGRAEGKPIGLGAAEGKPIGLGAAEGKPIGLGAAEGKPIGLGAAEGKPIGLGGTGPLFTLAEPSPEAIIADLFGQVGLAVRLIEEATADVETIAAKAMLGIPSGGSPVVAGNEAVAKREIDRGFRIVMEASTDARGVLRRTLAHPAYGFGPVSGGLGADDRRELARVGGFNSRQLILL